MSDELLNQPIVWVDTLDHLEQVCEHLETKKILAIDTEFMRSNTYYPIAGLIQISDGEKNYLIDPVELSDLSPLESILVDDDIVIAIHAGSEDIEVFHHRLGFLPSQLLDTQIAGALCGTGFSLGFGNMVNTLLGVELPKTQTRSNWLSRPLSVPQKNYAALDVEYLYELALTLIDKLAKIDRLDIAFYESKTLLKNFSEQLTPEHSYLRCKQAYKLSQPKLAVLQGLCCWREELAQIKDKPRNHIIKEPILFDIALHSPKDLSGLRKTKNIHEKTLKYYGEKILDIIAREHSAPKEQWPALVPKPLSSQSLNLVKKLREKVSVYALDNNIAPEILMKKKDYESVVLLYKKTHTLAFPSGFASWKVPHVEPILKAELPTQTQQQ